MRVECNRTLGAGWVNMPRVSDKGRTEVHIIPISDLFAHYVDRPCPCGAEPDGDNIFVHAAWDGREDYENGVREPH